MGYIYVFEGYLKGVFIQFDIKMIKYTPFPNPSLSFHDKLRSNPLLLYS